MPEQGASFIPKSGVKKVQRNRGTRRIYLLAYICYIVFFSTLFVVVGVYLYAATVNRSLSTLKEQLSVEQQRFSVSDIEQVRLFDKRMREATRLLEESSAPSRIFSDVESIVASNIYFSSMTYEQLPGRRFQIELVGRATNFNQLINQKELIGNSEILQDATITAYDYGLGDEGNLTGAASLAFTFADTRDLSIISYQPNITESTVIISDSTSTTTREMVDQVRAADVATSTANQSGDDAVVVGEPRASDSEDTTADDNSQNQ